jgi:hypothetical protein
VFGDNHIEGSLNKKSTNKDIKNNALSTIVCEEIENISLDARLVT